MNANDPRNLSLTQQQIGDPPTRLLGTTLIAFSLASALGFVVLMSAFDFPAILREPGGTVLEKYIANMSTIRPTYWMLGMTGLVLIGIASELGRVLSPYAPGPARLVSLSGAATGVFWALGYTRWPIAVPYLADMYQTGDKTRAAELYGLLNRYAGMTVGEHLGFIMMGVFAVALSLALRTAGIGPKWLFPVGMFAGILIAVTAAEQYNGSELLGAVNGAANSIWFLWLLAIGVILIRRSGNLSKATS
jgi:Domain of unknown function (DUF4386)